MARRPNPYKPEIRPWHPAPYSVDDVYALQNLAKGKATETQQVRALAWVVQTLCVTDGPDYFPDSDRDTCFASGKRSVGIQIRKLVNLPGPIVKALAERERAGKAKENDHGG